MKSMEVSKGEGSLEKSLEVTSKKSASKRSLRSIEKSSSGKPTPEKMSPEKASLDQSTEKRPREKKKSRDATPEKRILALRQSMKTPETNTLLDRQKRISQGDLPPLKRSTTIKSAKSSMAQSMSIRLGCHCKKSPILIVDDSVFN
mmetsp:Transcript_24067/g.37004  ORF Transcript_24067/g.37004 Transcript_24067/m.37004 type:complete len:146 (+) Transcript_24067:3697-4134(+)